MKTGIRSPFLVQAAQKKYLYERTVDFVLLFPPFFSVPSLFWSFFFLLELYRRPPLSALCVKYGVRNKFFTVSTKGHPKYVLYRQRITFPLGNWLLLLKCFSGDEKLLASIGWRNINLALRNSVLRPLFFCQITNKSLGCLLSIIQEILWGKKSEQDNFNNMIRFILQKFALHNIEEFFSHFLKLEIFLTKIFQSDKLISRQGNIPSFLAISPIATGLCLCQ